MTPIFTLSLNVYLFSFLLDRLLALCRDHHKQINKQAWKLFYEMFEYQSGVVEILEKNKLLVQFFDIVGTTAHGNVVVAHALHYISKVKMFVVFFLTFF